VGKRKGEGGPPVKGEKEKPPIKKVLCCYKGEEKGANSRTRNDAENCMFKDSLGRPHPLSERTRGAQRLKENRRKIDGSYEQNLAKKRKTAGGEKEKHMRKVTAGRSAGQKDDKPQTLNQQAIVGRKNRRGVKKGTGTGAKKGNPGEKAVRDVKNLTLDRQNKLKWKVRAADSDQKTKKKKSDWAGGSLSLHGPRKKGPSRTR